MQYYFNTERAPSTFII